MTDSNGLADQLAAMQLRAEGALQSLTGESFTARTAPVFTDTERRQNYWNGYSQALAEIQRFIWNADPGEEEP